MKSISTLRHCKILALIFWLFGTHVWAGQIQGKIIFDSNKKNIFVKEPVQLGIFENAREIMGSQTKLNRDGSYVFNNMDHGKNHQFVVRYIFQNFPYVLGPFSFQNNQHVLNVPHFPAFESMSKTQELSLKQSLVFDVNGSKQLLKIKHLIEIMNPSSMAYTPFATDSELISISLPKGGFDLSFLSGIDAKWVEINEKQEALLLRYPIMPSTHNQDVQKPFIEFSYSYFYNEKNFDLTFKSNVKTEQLSIDDRTGKLHNRLSLPNKLLSDESYTLSFKKLPMKNQLQFFVLVIGSLIVLAFALYALFGLGKQTLDLKNMKETLLKRLADIEKSSDFQTSKDLKKKSQLIRSLLFNLSKQNEHLE